LHIHLLKSPETTPFSPPHWAGFTLCSAVTRARALAAVCVGMQGTPLKRLVQALQTIDVMESKVPLQGFLLDTTVHQRRHTQMNAGQFPTLHDVNDLSYHKEFHHVEAI
jgi:hypothetical protein